MAFAEGTIDTMNPSAIWWTYLAGYDGLRGSTRVNMALRAGAPHRQFPHLLIFGTSYSSVRDDKLPDISEKHFLDEVSDELILSVMRLGPALYAGTFTNDLEQVHFVYVSRIDGAKAAFSDTHAALCQGRASTWIEREDPEWEQYLDFLCPNQATMEFYDYDLSQLNKPALPESPSRREILERAFCQMKEESGWDMSRDMLWGFFFTNDQREPLGLAAIELSQLGYRVVDTYVSDKDDLSEPDLWWLHVERIETHSVDSLHMRNDELTAFAKTAGLESYDGWDVGPTSIKGE